MGLSSSRNAAVQAVPAGPEEFPPAHESSQESKVSLRLQVLDQLGLPRLLRHRAFVAGILLFAAFPAWCSDPGKPSPFQAPWWGPESATLYGGFYGIRGPHKWENAVSGLEIRGGPIWWELRVITGALAASDGNFFAYAGVLADVPAWNVLHFILSFAPGYSASGTDHSLGFPLIFRSTAEVSFRVTAQTRLGVSFSHMSNGKLAEPNPGVETLSLTLTVLALPY
jgi:hypothetical protein